MDSSIVCTVLSRINAKCSKYTHHLFQCHREPLTTMLGLQQSLLKRASRDSSAETLPLEMKDARERPPMSRSASTILYDVKTDPAELSSRPWKNSAKFFQNAMISTLALTKMSVHAKRGGSIEVMGMLTGKIVGPSIVVCDVYPLPVEGTETRVNAQNEAYEYMVQYLDLLKKVGREEHIVGWYHSHPGYGCWLSGIDVATQSLNQNFQDPYLAIVVDPIRTVNQRKVDIGAFRAFPPGYVATDKLDPVSKAMPHVVKSKKQDYGTHAKDYYPLDIWFYQACYDAAFIDLVLDKSWVAKLLISIEGQKDYQRQLGAKIQEILHTPFQGLAVIESKEWKQMHELCEELIARRLETSSDNNDTSELITDDDSKFLADSHSFQAELDTDEESRINGEDCDEDEDDDDDEDEVPYSNDYANSAIDTMHKFREEVTTRLTDTEMEKNGTSDGYFSTSSLDTGKYNTVWHAVSGNETPTERRASAAAGQKRGFRASSTESRNRVPMGLLRKRLALSDAEGAFSNQFIHTQAEIRAQRDVAKNVGDAEYMQFLTSRIQRNVFGGL